METERRLCKEQDSDWSGAGTDQEHLEIPEAERGKKEISPRSFGGSMVLPTP